MGQDFEERAAGPSAETSSTQDSPVVRGGPGSTYERIQGISSQECHVNVNSEDDREL